MGHNLWLEPGKSTFSRMTLLKDGTLNFGNTLRANAYNSNSIIFTSNAVNINVGCSYATHYDDIELTTTVVGSDVSTDTEGPEGKFSFDLQMFNDAEMNNEVTEDDVTKIGEPLYFKLSQQFPVAGVIFAIDGELLTWLKIID